MGDRNTFSDVIAGNKIYAEGQRHPRIPAHAARGLAIVTCIDSRIEPLAMLGLVRGDAKILRNAGGRVTHDVLRTLVLAHYLLGVDRVMVIGHTDCRMTGGTEDDIHNAIQQAGGPDTRSLGFMTTIELEESVRADVQRIRSWPYLRKLRVGGFVYNVDTGHIRPIG